MFEEHEARLVRLEEAEASRTAREEDARKQMHALPAPTVPVADLPLRAAVSAVVRGAAIRRGGAFRSCWRHAYRQFRDRYHFDARARAKKQNSDALAVLEEAGHLPVFYALVMELYGAKSA